MEAKLMIKKHLARIIWLIAFLAITIMAATPIFAAGYSITLTITESAGTNYTNIPIIASINNAYYVQEAYMNSTALDTRVIDQNGTLSPHMVTNNSVVFVTNLSATADSIMDFQTLNSTRLPSMPIVLGYGGNFTTADAAELEPGSNFALNVTGYFNTSAASAGPVNKSGALVINTSTAQVTNSLAFNLSVPINASASPQCGNSSLGILYAGEKFYRSSGLITSVSLLMKRNNAPTGTGYLRIEHASNHSLIGNLGSIDVATLGTNFSWITFNTTPVDCSNITNYNVCFYFTGGDDGNYVYLGLSNTNNLLTANKTWFNGGSWNESVDNDINMVMLFSDNVNYPLNSGYNQYNLSYLYGNLTRGFNGNTQSRMIDAESTIPNTASNWIWMQGNSMPYAANISLTVNGTEVLRYQPVTMINGNVMPDRAGTAQNGTITWGTNPAGIATTVSYIYPYDMAYAKNFTISGYNNPAAPVPDMPAGMYEELSPTFPGASIPDEVSDAGGIPRIIFWWIFPSILILIAGILIHDKTKSLMAQAIIIGLAMLGMGLLHVWPLWMLIPFALYAGACVLAGKVYGY